MGASITIDNVAIANARGEVICEKISTTSCFSGKLPVIQK